MNHGVASRPTQPITVGHRLQYYAPDLLELLDFRASRHLRHPQLFARRLYTTQYMFHSAFPHLQSLANNLPRHLDFFNIEL
ncbi:hypothetical protein J6590_078390 [Homalodisca vitripennis]|nr:hypothetical protein J6590_078390 [Homalodisca vitripennis]